MQIDWIGCDDANFSTGRAGASVDKVIVHWMDSTLAGCDATFANPSRQASAHYGVGPDDNVHQYVNEEDTAWHAGNWDANITSIGIEHEGSPEQHPIVKTLDRSAELMADIARRYGWSELVWMVNVFPHNYFYATQCPGALDTDYLIKKANEILSGGSPAVVITQDASDPKSQDNFVYAAQVENLGWLPQVRDGQIAGTTGHGLRLESIRVMLNGLNGGKIRLAAKGHIENVGWVDYGEINEDTIIGTVGESKRLEAVEFEVLENTTGKKLRYELHLANKGWTGAVDADFADGTVGMGIQVEAIRMWLE